MFRLGIPLILAVLVLAGCGSQYSLNVVTVPPGATVWQAGAKYSYTSPAELALDQDHRHPTTKCVMVDRVYAKWQSGATAASQEHLQLCGEAGMWTLTLKRPSPVYRPI